MTEEVEQIKAELADIEERLEKAQIRETTQSLRASFAALQDENLPVMRILLAASPCEFEASVFAKSLERRIKFHRDNPEA